jgi:hypothetical protein
MPPSSIFRCGDFGELGINCFGSYKLTVSPSIISSGEMCPLTIGLAVSSEILDDELESESRGLAASTSDSFSSANAV